MTNLDSVLKSRDITLPRKVRLVKAMVFPVVIYGCESWTIKKAECQRIDAFELWFWRRLLRVPWTARRSNQTIPKEISPEYSLEGLMLKLKLQYFGLLMWRTDSLEKTPMLGKIQSRRRRGRQRMRWLDGITDLMDMSMSKLRGIGKNRGAWHAAVHGVTKSWTQLSDWATATTASKKDLRPQHNFSLQSSHSFLWVPSVRPGKVEWLVEGQQQVGPLNWASPPPDLLKSKSGLASSACRWNQSKWNESVTVLFQASAHDRPPPEPSLLGPQALIFWWGKFCCPRHLERSLWLLLLLLYTACS